MDTHALHATLDDGHDPEPTHISHPDPDNHSDPEIDWSEAFVNSDARASDIDALEEALRTFTLTPDDKIIVLASDGVWEFMTNQQVANIVYPFFI